MIPGGRVTIFTDVSELNKVDFISGIQRVVTEVMVRWIDAGERVVLGVYSPEKDAFELVDKRKFRDYYRHVSDDKAYLTGELLPVSDLDENYVFFDMDSVWMNSNKRGYLLPKLRSQGVRLAVHSYDIIPITNPEYCDTLTILNFMDHLAAYLENAELIISNANATLDAIEKVTEGKETHFSTAVVKLGRDLSKRADSSAGGSERLPQRTAKLINGRPYILMVGTLEPRKNHAYILDAFDKRLFDEGLDLVFAGRLGWNIEEFMERVVNHPMYDRQLFMIENASDQEIEALYTNAFFVAFASLNEGFGLPIIEAFDHGTPVLVSDIPVLRETGEEYADYFSLDDVDDFIDKVLSYKNDASSYERKKKSVAAFKCTGWDECAATMMEVIKRQFS